MLLWNFKLESISKRKRKTSKSKMLKALNCFSEHERMGFDLQLIVELVR